VVSIGGAALRRRPLSHNHRRAGSVGGRASSEGPKKWAGATKNIGRAGTRCRCAAGGPAVRFLGRKPSRAEGVCQNRVN
jgi:hypothetical protein